MSSDTSGLSLQALYNQADSIRDIAAGLQDMKTEVVQISSSIDRLASIHEGLNLMALY